MDVQLRQDRQGAVSDARDALMGDLLLPRVALLHSAVEAIRQPRHSSADGDVPGESFEDALWRADVRAEVQLLEEAAKRIGRPQDALERAASRASMLAVELVVVTVALPVTFSEAVTHAGVPLEVTAAAGGITLLMTVAACTTFVRLVRARRRMEQLIADARMAR